MGRSCYAAFRAVVLGAIFVLVLGGCAAVASGTDASPPSLGAVSVQGVPTAAWSSLFSNGFSSGNMSSGNPQYAAYWLILFGYTNALTIDALLQTTLANWTPDQPSTYTFGTYTFSWARNGNSWTWSITYTDQNATVWTYVVTLTETSSGWDVALTQDGHQWLSGSAASGGSSGTAVFSDPTGQSTGSVTTAWEPDQSPYALKFMITGTGDFASLAGNNATTATVDLETDTAGSYWSYVYSDNATPTPGSYSDQYPFL